MIKVFVNVEPRYPVARKKIREKVENILKQKRVRKDKVEVGISIVGERKMRQLSHEFLDEKDGEHEVLSFPLEGVSKNEVRGFIRSPDDVLRLGDVVISFPQARANAAQENILVEEQLEFLVEHGLLHLLGIHHD